MLAMCYISTCKTIDLMGMYNTMVHKSFAWQKATKLATNLPPQTIPSYQNLRSLSIDLTFRSPPFPPEVVAHFLFFGVWERRRSCE